MAWWQSTANRVWDLPSGFSYRFPKFPRNTLPLSSKVEAETSVILLLSVTIIETWILNVTFVKISKLANHNVPTVSQFSSSASSWQIPRVVVTVTTVLCTALSVGYLKQLQKRIKNTFRKKRVLRSSACKPSGPLSNLSSPALTWLSRLLLTKTFTGMRILSDFFLQMHTFLSGRGLPDYFSSNLISIITFSFERKLISSAVYFTFVRETPRLSRRLNKKITTL